ncbi:extracellular catalytic domain type 1 short-chain-length polyhydroxyalkanoate depolymerase [Thermococcus celericrescens]|nr:PHB depolymerase family esterase [Thermococcus celericrescens]
MISGALIKKNRLYPGDVRESIVVDGIERTFILHLPPSGPANGSLPLVIALHGGGGDGFDMEKLTESGLNRLANENGFIVVYPDAIGKHWNDGRNLSWYRSHRENVDDVGFIEAIIDYLIGNYGVDPKNVFVVGMSNGGLMTYRLACDIPERLGAIAVVGVSMSENLYKDCPSGLPVPILIILGTDDPLVPWNGGELHLGPVKLGRVVSINETIDYWVERNGCTNTSEGEYLPDKGPGDGTEVWKEHYFNCREGAEVVFYGIAGGGHTWPGGYQYLPEKIVGKTSRDIDANRVVWEFFRRHLHGA